MVREEGGGGLGCGWVVGWWRGLLVVRLIGWVVGWLSMVAWWVQGGIWRSAAPTILQDLSKITPRTQSKQSPPICRPNSSLFASAGHMMVKFRGGNRSHLCCGWQASAGIGKLSSTSVKFG